MNRHDAARRDMLAGTLFRISQTRSPYDIERAEALTAWLKRTGREDIIAEAHRLCNEKIALKNRGE